MVDYRLYVSEWYHDSTNSLSYVSISHKTALYFSMSAFLIGSIIAALSPTFGLLMFARVIQAIGAGILLPLMQFTVFTLFLLRNVDLQWDLPV